VEFEQDVSVFVEQDAACAWLLGVVDQEQLILLLSAVFVLRDTLLKSLHFDVSVQLRVLSAHSKFVDQPAIHLVGLSFAALNSLLLLTQRLKVSVE